MVKILHMADVHLDRKTEGLSPQKSALRRAEYKETFEKAIMLAKEENVKIILIAGDLFDSEITDLGTVDFVQKALAKVPEISVFISPGSHDPYTLKPYRELEKNLSDNVKIFKNRFEKIDIPSLKTSVFGIGFETEIQEKSLLSGFSVPQSDNDNVNIICIHGDLKSQSSYNPILQSDIAETGADYVALGHTHTYSGILSSANTFYAYSGALEPHGFDETGEKGVLMGEVGKKCADLKFVSLEKRRFNVCNADITDCQTFDDVIAKIRPLLTRKDDFYKVILTGEKKEEIKLKTDVLAEFFENDVFFIKIKDETNPLIDLESLCEEYTLKGMCAKKICNDLNEENSEFYNKVADYLFGLF